MDVGWSRLVFLLGFEVGGRGCSNFWASVEPRDYFSLSQWTNQRPPKSPFSRRWLPFLKPVGELSTFSASLFGPYEKVGLLTLPETKMEPENVPF